MRHPSHGNLAKNIFLRGILFLSFPILQFNPEKTDPVVVKNLAIADFASPLIFFSFAICIAITDHGGSGQLCCHPLISTWRGSTVSILPNGNTDLQGLERNCSIESFISDF